ncbi:hypothetical protein CC78DRAFT_602319 [Lojkania enalia]|uniref:Uncharacterized protein n=1 Tax=Lojkania enalia TaxID=147567 RepID=A0A9P4K8Y6_9PLEO|nr:hypothetical protein CC78DRAFT_602319 [Didymosphaeria enalia]
MATARNEEIVHPMQDHPSLYKELCSDLSKREPQADTPILDPTNEEDQKHVEDPVPPFSKKTIPRNTSINNVEDPVPPFSKKTIPRNTSINIGNKTNNKISKDGLISSTHGIPTIPVTDLSGTIIAHVPPTGEYIIRTNPTPDGVPEASVLPVDRSRILSNCPIASTAVLHINAVLSEINALAAHFWGGAQSLQNKEYAKSMVQRKMGRILALFDPRMYRICFSLVIRSRSLLAAFYNPSLQYDF